MAKITKQTLIDLGCLNPDDYVGCRESNLEFKCVDCGDVYYKNIDKRKRQIKNDNHSCSNCVHKAPKKQTKHKLKKNGCK